MTRTFISVEGIECYAYHGCLKEESLIGGRFSVDVHIESDMQKAIQSDKLSDAIDYVSVNKIVKEQMAIRSDLIEHAGGRIMNALIDNFPQILSIELKVIKFNPPVNGYVERTVFTISSKFE